ncbi:MAG: isoleucine--tRNA ligase [Candidatus Thermoplasmatota archaeon]|jgi:isoleucyl-tRNA synthetase|nr:isoleucine--tRNA ligase [Candidatus Thermoplasmatota archaeon]MDP7264781.1 isoleucine--tRNA ligase [Candidatus Thermoplasmatota archaeon]
MIEQVNTKYDPNLFEPEIQQYWKDNKAYELTKEKNQDGPNFYFIDGPPYTSGAIHLGTAWNKILKDLYIRYWRMQGYNIRDQAGYDMHGLPIEVKVEKALNFSNKQDIEKHGIDNFVKTCREFALSSEKVMTEQFKQLGVWLDWDNPYRTLENYYIESAWWTIKRAHDRKLITQAQRVLTWCPRCETALAEAEVEYWDETDASIYVKFKVKNREDHFIVIWTTTPWTLPADLCVAVHPDFSYVLMEVIKNGEKEYLYVAEDLAEEVAKEGRYQEMKIIEKFEGIDLEGLEYEQPLLDEVPWHSAAEQKELYWLHKTVLAEYVTLEKTGIVHTAPGHGPDDFETGVEYQLPPFCPVDEAGKFTKDGGKWAGRFTKNCDSEIMDLLAAKGTLLQSGDITHRYGHCWRCKTPITYRTTTQWFLKVTEMKEKMLEEILKTDWYPDWAGRTRQYKWVENTRDWCISRQRYWGIPMPIWACGCGEKQVVGYLDELEKGKNYTKDMDLHRPWIDKVTLECGKCGGEMTRIPDVLDVWFDSAICSWAQLKYPQEKEEFEKWWPCGWITEAHDQTRGWFYSQLGASVIAFDKIPYEKVLMHGFALDKEYRKMSKSDGNATSPHEIIEKYGVDSLRFYLLVANSPWEDLPFSWDGVKNGNRTLNILWNIYRFSTTYMALDEFDPEKWTYRELENDFRAEDRWLYSRLEKAKSTSKLELEKFNVHKSLRAIEHFILEDLSRWYVRLVRDRTWVEGESRDKLAAFRVLYDALLEISLLLSPFTPHIAEKIYKNLSGKFITIAMENCVTVADERRSDELEVRMKAIRSMVEAILNARQQAQVNVRWPLRKVVAVSSTTVSKKALETYGELMKEQINAITIELVEPGETWEGVKLTIEPVMAGLGPTFKREAVKVANLIKEMNPTEAMNDLEKGHLNVMLNGVQVNLTKEMVQFGQALPEEVISADYSDGVIYIDTVMTPELQAMGFARELIRRIQEMRKEMDLAVEDYISTRVLIKFDVIEGENVLAPEVENIKYNTRSKKFGFGPMEDDDFAKEWEIAGEKFTIGIKRL